MRILVTGAAGFIGSHLCERLVLYGHTVLGVDSFESHLYPAKVKRQNVAKLLDLRVTSGFRLIEANICDGEAMDQIMGQSIDLVCHLGALAGVRPSLVAPERYMRTNVEGTAVLLRACRNANVERIVFASSSSVYGVKDDPSPFSETDPCLHPASPYAASKRFGELLLSTYRDLYGIGATCLRFFTVFGPRQRPDMAIHKFVHAVAAGNPITIFGDGLSCRDYTYIDDIVDGIVPAAEHLKADSFNLFNLGGGHVTTLNELVSLIEEVVGRRAIIEHAPEQFGDVPITSADTTLAQTTLKYRPNVSVRDGLERYWLDFKLRSAQREAGPRPRIH